MEMKTLSVQVSVEAEKQIRKIAEEQSRSIAGQIRHMLNASLSMLAGKKEKKK